MSRTPTGTGAQGAGSQPGVLTAGPGPEGRPCTTTCSPYTAWPPGGQPAPQLVPVPPYSGGRAGPERRLSAKELKVLEKTLESPLDFKKLKPVSPKGLNPEYSLEGRMLKLQCSGHLKGTANSLEKTLMLGKMEGRRRRGSRGWDSWMASLTQWT